MTDRNEYLDIPAWYENLVEDLEEDLGRKPTESEIIHKLDSASIYDFMYKYLTGRA